MEPRECHCCHVIGPGPYNPSPEDIARDEAGIREWLEQNIVPRLAAAAETPTTTTEKP